MLREILLAPSRRDSVVDDCVKLIDAQVAKKSGITGIAVKGGYAVVKKLKPGFVRDAADHLIDDFVERLEPFYADWKKNSPHDTLEHYFAERAAGAADALLGVTDAKAERAKNVTLRKTYEKMRPAAARHVEEAMPDIARLIAAHASATAAA